MGFIGWLTLLLIALKLLGLISWSWFYVFLPAIADLVISVKLNLKQDMKHLLTVRS